MTDRIKQLFGPKCTAVNINGDSDSFINIPSRKMTLCEAVNFSFKVPVSPDLYFFIENADTDEAKIEYSINLVC